MGKCYFRIRLSLTENALSLTGLGYYLWNFIFVQMFSLLRFLLVGLLIACSFLALGQDPYYTSINKLSGLPSNTIYDIFQDSKGFIWIANNEGLTRYDGFEFTTYIHRNQTSRSGNQIKEDKYGRIWYKNFDGYLYYVENDSLQPLKQNTPIGDASYAILNNRILVLQKDGVDYYDVKTLNRSYLKKLDQNMTFTGSQLQYKGKFYLVFEDCLLELDENGHVQSKGKMPPLSLIGGKNGVMLVDGSGINSACFEITENGIKEKISLRHIKYGHGMSYCNNINWFFTPNGVWAYDDQAKSINNDQPFYASKSISSILHDRDGNYWLGTLNEGILFVPDLGTKLFETPGYVPNILSTSGKKLFIGTKDNALYTYDLASGQFEKKFQDKLRHEVICVLADPVNNLFSFSSTQLFVCDTSFKNVKGYKSNSIKDLVIVDRKYYAFAASGMIGLFKVRSDIASPFDSLYNKYLKDGMENMATIIESTRGRDVAYSSSTGRIYAGTGKGLYIIDTNGAKELKRDGAIIYCKKMISYRNNIYLLTPQNRVVEINSKNEFRDITLPGDNEQYINMKLAGNNLYLLATSGIRVLDTITGNAKILHLHPAIRSEEINDLEVAEGRLIFSTERGLLVVGNSIATQAEIPPTFIINNLLVNGNKVAKDSNLVFAYKENDIELSYSILSFSTDNRYKLFYQINDGKWQQNSQVTRTLKLASLAPGNYTVAFRLGQADSDKFFSAGSVKFTIRKPFWMEWWFLGGCVAIVAVSGFAYNRWRTLLMKKQNQLVVEKIELERNLRNSMLTSIRSQMNPHFFYNALNAIQSFIFADDKRSAATYLVKLSKLTRLILEMSAKESVSLDEETDALKLYLELEQMRFSDDFNYELHIGSNVDGDMVKIPPMIVQPYVENAIKHGLLHKKGGKYLRIAFEKIAEDIRITIDDNGIGREKADELNQIKKEKHNSFSTEANSKRIELLNKESGRNIGVVYIDKKDNNNTAMGTTVIITIPLNSRK